MQLSRKQPARWVCRRRTSKRFVPRLTRSLATSKTPKSTDRMFTRGSFPITQKFILLRSSLRARKLRSQQHLPHLQQEHPRNLRAKRQQLSPQHLLPLRLLQRRQRARRLLLNLQQLQKLTPSRKLNQLLMQRPKLQQNLQWRLQSLRLKPSDLLTFFVY